MPGAILSRLSLRLTAARRVKLFGPLFGDLRQGFIEALVAAHEIEFQNGVQRPQARPQFSHSLTAAEEEMSSPQTCKAMYVA